MNNEKLAQHIANKLWRFSKNDILEAINSFKGDEIKEQPQQRDYTGVRFEHKDGIPFDGGIIAKLENGIYTINYPDSSTGSCKVEDFNVNRLFEKGIWIELPPETSSIHVEKPNTLEDRVKALELNKEMIYKILEEVGQRLESIENTPIIERKKRNLPIDDDWKKVECLSWEDVQPIYMNFKEKGLWEKLETCIKEKLSKK